MSRSVPTTRRFLLDWYLEVFALPSIRSRAYRGAPRAADPLQPSMLPAVTCMDRGRSTLSGGVWKSAALYFPPRRMLPPACRPAVDRDTIEPTRPR